MTKTKRSDVCAALRRLAVQFGVSMGRSRMTIYLNHLSDLHDASVLRAIEHSAQWGYRFPSIAELRRLAGVRQSISRQFTPDLVAIEAWVALRYGCPGEAYNPLALDDPCVARVVRACWGSDFGLIGLWPDHEETVWREMFLELYVSYWALEFDQFQTMRRVSTADGRNEDDDQTR